MQHLAITTIGDLLVRGADEVPDRTALVIGGRRLTYRELHDRATAVAASMRALGVGRGDRIGILMPNSFEFLEVVFGAAYLGAITVPVNARFRRAELQHVVPDAHVRVLFLNDAASDQADHLARLGEAFPDLPGQDTPDAVAPRPLSLGGAPELEHVVAFGTPSSPGVLGDTAFRALGSAVDADEVDRARQGVAIRHAAMMFYTSGTTSMPKGVPLTHEALVRVGTMTAQRFGYRDGDVMFDPLPMFHTASTQPMIATMHVRGTFVSQVFPDPDEGLALIRDEGATVMFTAFPAVTEGLLNHPDYGPDTFADVRSVFNVAPPDALRSMQARMPHSVLVNAFGMTEAAGSATMVDPDEDDDVRLTTQGRPLPGIEIGVRDAETGEPVPAGTMGEIVLRGPSLFDGYHEAPEKNAETIGPDGFWHSGDLGVLRPDGRLEFKGRLKDMLKVGGENVAAIEIESHLQAHPAVNIAQVVGVPDPRYGEVPAAFIELRPGREATAEEIVAHCEGAIAGFKVPRHVRFVAPGDWPMSSTKVQKFRLREQLEAELGALA